MDFKEIFTEYLAFPLSFIVFNLIFFAIGKLLNSNISKKLGPDIVRVSLGVSNKKNQKIFRYIIFTIITLYILANILLEDKNWIVVATHVAFMVFFLYLPQPGSEFIIGPLGLLVNGKAILWENIKSLEWDRDIKQSFWAVKIHSKGKAYPERMFFPRDRKPEIESLIDKYKPDNL